MCYVKCRSGNPSDRQQLSQQTCVMAAHIITALALLAVIRRAYNNETSFVSSDQNSYFMPLTVCVIQTQICDSCCWTGQKRVAVSRDEYIFAPEIDSSKMVLKKVNLPPFDNTSATSYLCNIFLGQDTMSRMGLPVWLDNKHFAHFGHWSCHLRYQGPFMCSNISS